MNGIPVRVGLDRVTEPAFRPLFEGRRLGLVSNMSGLSVVHGWRSPVDVMHRLYKVSALFAPEHGTRGVLGPGEKVAGGRDELTGLWSYSLFEDMVFAPEADKAANERAYMPAGEVLTGLDIMVFDMQDVGSRYFTYASTLFYTMRACAARGLPLCVLDRPNPLGGTVVEGARQASGCTSFIGLGLAPIRHGLTMGELARYYNDAYAIGCDLTVVPCAGLDRTMLWADTGLPFVKPSPNLPSPDAVIVYNGTCMLAGTNVSEGRGTTTPFTTIGAPFIRPDRLADAMNDLHLPGLVFSPAFFRPSFGKYAGEVCRGVDLHVTDARAVRAVTMGVHLIHTIRTLFPENFAFTPPKEGTRWHIDLSTGSPEVREGKSSPEDLLSRWDADARAFREKTKQFWLYS
ncbi:MAG: DUF1343 domain-containing protein [Clostridia bacterium]|nr:DUF1343 domain-containing protein [Clostridia bacterium]